MSQTICILNKLDEIEKVVQVLSTFSKIHGIAAETVHEIRLALDEIITNIISYGYVDKGDHQIEVLLDMSNKAAVLEIKDNARPFNPLQMPLSETSMPFDERDAGGLGIFIARSVMDEITYRFANGHNILTLKKHIRSHSAYFFNC